MRTRATAKATEAKTNAMAVGCAVGKRAVQLVCLCVLVGLTAMPVAAQEPVDINSASARELAKTIKGVGKKLSKRIVEFREMYGPFPSVEALTEVRGIGRKVLRRNRHRLVALPLDEDMDMDSDKDMPGHSDEGMPGQSEGMSGHSDQGMSGQPDEDMAGHR